MAKTKSFEQDLKGLEDIVTKLETGNVSLDEAIRLFQKGRALSHSCEARLREVERKIQKLLEDEDGEPRTVAFDETADIDDEGVCEDKDDENPDGYDEEEDL